MHIGHDIRALDATIGGGIGRHRPGVRQLTRRNCPLLNCESVLWGIEADGLRPRGSRAPQRSETKISSTRLSSMIRNGLIATCFVCLLSAGTDRAHGLDPSKRLTQYRHNVWRVQDGFFPGSPSWASQTADGYLWVVTSSGVFRFDGVRFVPWSPPPSASNDTEFSSLQRAGDFGSTTVLDLVIYEAIASFRIST